MPIFTPPRGSRPVNANWSGKRKYHGSGGVRGAFFLIKIAFFMGEPVSQNSVYILFMPFHRKVWIYVPEDLPFCKCQLVGGMGRNPFIDLFG